MRKFILAATAATLAITSGTGGTAQTRPAGGTAHYWMSAETMSGFAANAMSQNRRGGMGAMLAGGSQSDAFVHNLTLQLGSPRRPTGAPMAEHLPPSTLNAGPSLPLVSPEAANPNAPTRPPVQGNGDGGAQGRILIYWGCGEHIRQGQPATIDLARLSSGQRQAVMTGLNIRLMEPPSSTTSATYGEWPNQRSRTTIPANGSLAGDHVIRGNYSPEIRFSLTQAQDFLAPVAITGNSRAPSGAVPVSWRPVPNARAYYMMTSGARGDGTIVVWSSSEIQLTQSMFDYLSPEEITRLLQQRVLLQPSVTQCTVPAEVSEGMQTASLMVTAFGPEANFSYPARPANAPRGWAPDWTAKLRTRSVHMGMLGMDMSSMMRSAQGEPARQAPQAQPQRRRGRSLLERAIGF